MYFKKPFEPSTAKSQPEVLELMAKHLTANSLKIMMETIKEN